MNSVIKDIEDSLSAQQIDLEDKIRKQEAILLTYKEGYLKVLGALEIVGIIKEKYDAVPIET